MLPLYQLEYLVASSNLHSIIATHVPAPLPNELNLLDSQLRSIMHHAIVSKLQAHQTDLVLKLMSARRGTTPT
jgi:hypothetical protein